MRQLLVYAMAGGISFIGHAALVWYGNNTTASASLSPAGARQTIAVQLVAEKKPLAGDTAGIDMHRADADAARNSPVVDSAKSERLFPAFYGVHYYAPKELTQKPFITQDIPRDFALHVPDAPANAAVFLLLINEHGAIDRVIVESSSLPQSAQAKLEDAFSTVKFFPGQIKGVPVKSALKIQIHLDTGVAEK